MTDPTLVPSQIAATLGVREQPGLPLLSSLLAMIGAGRFLLVLDNCEHLIAICAEIAEVLLHGCPQLKILATSREALLAAGEVVWAVPPLATPANGHARAADVDAFEAVQLFVDRARLAVPSFTTTPASASAVGEICQRLDGLPLAIELAAARLRVLTPEQIASRLDNRFKLLVGGPRTALPRHQTLAAAIQWSYDLLSAPEHGSRARNRSRPWDIQRRTRVTE
jgi:predicted ATPase